ncbi:Uncharacterised protein [Mycolicibacterium fortuitum]|uniref:Uncharacterized protein n=1 Tax=Mycolicibacterium fortuitum TaxID=1766 RepID=A0A378U8Q4_MYCFO|nr:hypothetical protein [Mycolicibacterium fortuitum]STZ73716.1 Uncharacterised protein [Mycolicibacterium fortuitum]
MSAYSTAWDTMAGAIGAAEGSSSGSIAEVDHLTVDQRLKAAEISALLAIAEELSRIRHYGINPEFVSRPS